MCAKNHLIGPALFSGSVWALIGKVSAIGAAIATNALLARSMSPDSFGVYLLAASIVTTVCVMTSLGTGSTLVRLLGDTQNHLFQTAGPHGLVRACLTLAAVGGAVFAALALSPPGVSFTQFVFRSELLTASLVALIAWTLTLSWQSVVAEAHRGLKDIRLASLLSGPVPAIGLLAAIIVLVALGGAIVPSTVLWLCALSSLLSFLIGFAKLPRSPANSSGRTYRQILEISLPMMVTSLAAVLLNQADIWVVGIVLEKTQVALYGSALALASLVSFPLLILNSAASPYIAEAGGKGQLKSIAVVLRSATGVASLVSGGALLAFALFGPTILGLVYGEYYRDASAVLLILSAGRVANVVTGPCGLVLLMTGYHRLMMWVNIAAAAIMILLMALVAKPYGIVGVAIVAAAVMWAHNIVMLVTVRARTGIWTYMRLPLGYS